MAVTLKPVSDLDKDRVQDLNLPVSARIANLLERAILEGRYRPGERLREVELANRLGVSRTPLREAFYALETRGLIRIQPRRGAFVKSVTIEEMEELLTIRVALDGLAAFLAAENAEAADIEELERVHNSQRSALGKKDDSAFHALGQDFHNLIYAASGNPKLNSIYRSLRVDAALYAVADILLPGEAEKSLEDHSAMLAAIASRKSTNARDIAERHIRRIRDHLKANLPADSNSD
ncbi:MAG: GntR family transcriptional regulator [Rhodospirillaceae bacterium]|nr:GntR family transcriptional regulator [Rhodospirillaceae bacterium]